eukprot:gene31814-38465_t
MRCILESRSRPLYIVVHLQELAFNRPIVSKRATEVVEAAVPSLREATAGGAMSAEVVRKVLEGTVDVAEAVMVVGATAAGGVTVEAGMAGGGGKLGVVGRGGGGGGAGRAGSGGRG